jgi:hypothetical protein
MKHKTLGQATVEYVFILAVACMLGFEVTRRFTDFFQKQMGKVGHVLSTHLTVGVCPRNCFYGGYYNSYSGSSP